MVHEVRVPGASLPATSEIHCHQLISIDPRGNRDVISTRIMSLLTGIAKAYFDALANLSVSQNVILRWAFSGQVTPIFTHTFILIQDSMGGCGGGIVFARSIDQERKLANSMQYNSRASPDPYTNPMPQQTHYQPTTPRLASSVPSAKRSTRYKPHRAVSDHQCWAAAAADDGWPVTPTRSATSDAARQVNHRLLEASRRYASEAYTRTGSTNEFSQTRELSQKLLAADLRWMQDTWQSPR